MSFYGCYALESLSVKDAVYIGFTVNPERRIRQHNGKITAGARKTSGKRPWEMMVCVHGFTNKITALKFEWAWQNPRHTKCLGHIVDCIRFPRGALGVFLALHLLLRTAPWNTYPLHVLLLTDQAKSHFSQLEENDAISVRAQRSRNGSANSLSDGSKKKKLGAISKYTLPPLPSHMTVQRGSLSDLICDIDAEDQPEDSDGENHESPIETNDNIARSDLSSNSEEKSNGLYSLHNQFSCEEAGTQIDNDYDFWYHNTQDLNDTSFYDQILEDSEDESEKGQEVVSSKEGHNYQIHTDSESTKNGEHNLVTYPDQANSPTGWEGKDDEIPLSLDFDAYSAGLEFEQSQTYTSNNTCCVCTESLLGCPSAYDDSSSSIIVSQAAPKKTVLCPECKVCIHMTCLARYLSQYPQAIIRLDTDATSMFSLESLGARLKGKSSMSSQNDAQSSAFPLLIDSSIDTCKLKASDKGVSSPRCQLKLLPREGSCPSCNRLIVWPVVIDFTRTYNLKRKLRQKRDDKLKLRLEKQMERQQRKRPTRRQPLSSLPLNDDSSNVVSILTTKSQSFTSPSKSVSSPALFSSYSFSPSSSSAKRIQLTPSSVSEHDSEDVYDFQPHISSSQAENLQKQLADN